jgi:DNA-directed RNA polymerase subunit RPC12/RpoP
MENISNLVCYYCVAKLSKNDILEEDNLVNCSRCGQLYSLGLCGVLE